VLVLRYYEGRSDREIAELLGCQPGTVRGYVSRALATLRVEMR
jgi:RNA polymerase sigma factor (sigma-70 family)